MCLRSLYSLHSHQSRAVPILITVFWAKWWIIIGDVDVINIWTGNLLISEYRSRSFSCNVYDFITNWLVVIISFFFRWILEGIANNQNCFIYKQINRSAFYQLSADLSELLLLLNYIRAARYAQRQTTHTAVCSHLNYKNNIGCGKKHTVKHLTQVMSAEYK